MVHLSVQKPFRYKKRTSVEVKEKETYSEMAKNIIRISDIVLEVIDARFIAETRNLDVEKMIRDAGKTLIFVLNKADLTDMRKVKENLPEDLRPYVFVSCTTRQGIKDLRDRIKIEVNRAETDEKFKRKHVGIIGYPNTGKSSLINILIGKKVARTSSQSGFTRGVQKLKLAENLLLIDTPGVIPEKEFYLEKTMQTGRHAMIGARTHHQIKDPESDVYSIIKKYPGVIEKFYGFKEEIDFEEFIEQLGRKKNFIVKGNRVDEMRVYKMILKDWQEGRIRL